MNNSFKKHPLDLGVNFVPPQDVTDIRIPTAEEQSLSVEAQILAIDTAETLRFEDVPFLNLEADTLTVRGSLKSNLVPQKKLMVDRLLEVQNLERNATEYFYLATFVVIVGGEHDPLLNKFSLRFESIAQEKENTRRYRSYSAILSSYEPIDRDGLLELFSQGSLNVTNQQLFQHQELNFYPDSSWTIGEYRLLKTFELTPICEILHYWDYRELGYRWQEQKVLKTFAGNLDRPNWDATEPLSKIMAGRLLKNQAQQRAVLNLNLGAVASSPQAGITAYSPNGSIAIANDQRVSFVNEARSSHYGVQHLTASKNPQGQTVITATLNTNNPSGTRFSADATKHRVFSDRGELTTQGVFTNLGSDRSLSWIAGEELKIEVGDRLILQPEIEFPSGSGFKYPLRSIVNCYYNQTPLDPRNILVGYAADLEEYAAPFNGESFWLVYTPERSGIIYVYQKYSITANDEGMLLVPPEAGGAIAFIEGMAGRVDRALASGFAPNSTHNVLLYHPLSADASWQVEAIVPPYQGLGESALEVLHDATIISEPVCYLHSQGGGSSVFQSEGDLRYSPIAGYLPRLAAQEPIYKFNAPVHLLDEIYPGPYTIAKLSLQIGRGLALPTRGKRIQAVIRGIHEPQSLNLALYDRYGNLLGCRFPLLNDSAALYQMAIAFWVARQNLKRLVVATFNGRGGDEIRFDGAAACAIDLFAP